MLPRLWLLLVCALALAPLPAPAAALPMAATSMAVEDEQPTVAADLTPLRSDLRASEGAERLTVVARVLATGGALPSEAASRAAPGRARGARRATGWCDVVQCRRWAGAQLLRYATPPPARA